MAHIRTLTRKDGSKAYEVRWAERVKGPDGQVRSVRHRQKTFRTHKAAKDFKPLHEADALRGDLRNYDAAALPLEHYAEQWLRSLHGEIKSRTLGHYEQALRTHVLPALGHRAVGSIAVSDVREFKDYLLKRGLASSSVKGTFSTLRRTLDLALEDRAIRFNPAASVKMPTDAKLGRPRFKPQFLTERDVDALALALGERQPYDLMVRFLAWTGLRRGELAGLDVADVRLWRTQAGWRGYVDVHRTRRKVRGEWLADTPKSERSTRRVDLQDWLAEDLHAYLSGVHPRGDDPSAPLFPNRRRGGYTHGRRGLTSEEHGALNWDEPIEPGAFHRNVFRPALLSAGLPGAVRLHDLRHTYASLALMRGASPYWVSEQMGHSSYKITLDVYAHYIPKDDVHPLNGRPQAVGG